MSDAATLQKVKRALQISYSDFDTTIDDLIDAAVADLGIAGITGESVALSDPLVLNAVISYVGMNWSETKDYQRYKDAYETQKGQLWSSTGYTDWSGES
jgi:hypothetical protein